MVARLKDKGIEEVKSLKRRALTLAGKERISKADADFIVDHCNAIEARIVKMPEKPVRPEERRTW